MITIPRAPSNSSQKSIERKLKASPQGVRKIPPENPHITQESARNRSQETVHNIIRRHRPHTILKKHQIYRGSPPKIRSKSQLQFDAAPVKMIIVEPKALYCKELWLSVAIGLIHICIGAICFTILHYYLVTNDIHAVLCGFAFNFFTTEAILSLSRWNGWSTFMRIRHRKLAHIYLQVCSFVCAIAGTVLIVANKGIPATFHSVTGFLAIALMTLSLMLGTCTFIKSRNWLVILHMTFGLATFLIATACLCSGLLLEPFRDYGGSMTYVLIALVSFIVFCIVPQLFIRCVSKF